MGKAEIVKQELGRTLFIDAWTQSVRRRAIYTPYEPGIPFIKCQVYEADLAGSAAPRGDSATGQGFARSPARCC